jgi:hypothetical protein
MNDGETNDIQERPKVDVDAVGSIEALISEIINAESSVEVSGAIDALSSIVNSNEQAATWGFENKAIDILVGLLLSNSTNIAESSSIYVVNSAMVAITAFMSKIPQVSACLCNHDVVCNLISFMTTHCAIDTIHNSVKLLSLLLKLCPKSRVLFLENNGIRAISLLWLFHKSNEELVKVFVSMLGDLILNDPSKEQEDDSIATRCIDDIGSVGGWELLLTSFIDFDAVGIRATLSSILDVVLPLHSDTMTLFRGYPNIVEHIFTLMKRTDITSKEMLLLSRLLRYWKDPFEEASMGIRATIRSCDGVSTLVGILLDFSKDAAIANENAEMLVQILDAVAFFSQIDEEFQTAFHQSGGISILIKLLKPTIHNRISRSTVECISILISGNQAIVEALLNGGAIPFLVNQLLSTINICCETDNYKDEAFLLELCDILAHLTESQLAAQELFGRLIMAKLIQYLTTISEANSKCTYAVTVLHVMLEHNCQKTLELFVNFGGLQALLQHLRVLLDFEPIHIPSLVHVLNIYKALLCDMSVDKQDTVRNAGGMTVFVMMLSKFCDQFETLASTYWVLMIDVISFAAKGNFESRIAFGEAGGIPVLVRLLRENFNIAGDKPYRNNLIDNDVEASTLLNFMSLLIILLTASKVSQDAFLANMGVQFAMELFLNAPPRYRRVERCSYATSQNDDDWWSPLRRMMVMLLSNLAFHHPPSQELLCSSPVLPTVGRLASLYVVNPKQRRLYGQSQQDVLDNSMVLTTFLHAMVWPHFTFGQDSLRTCGLLSLLMKWLTDMDFHAEEYVSNNAEFLTTLNVCLERHTENQKWFVQANGLSILAKWLEQDCVYLSSSPNKSKPKYDLDAHYREARRNVVETILHLISNASSTDALQSSSGGSEATTSSSSSSSRKNSSIRSLEEKAYDDNGPTNINADLHRQHKDLIRNSGILALLIRMFSNRCIQQEEEDLAVLVKVLYFCAHLHKANTAVLKQSKISATAATLLQASYESTDIRSWILALKAIAR